MDSMRIVLIRHGKPEMSVPGIISNSQIRMFIDEYNQSGLAEEQLPPGELDRVISDCKTLLCSDYQRSFQSALKIRPDEQIVKDKVFREAQLPYAIFRSPKLPTIFWVVLYRLLWIVGFSKNSESYQQTKQRAKRATQQLISIAESKGDIVLVGHGYLNRFIARELRRLGWQGPKSPPGRYWGCAEYLKVI